MTSITATRKVSTIERKGEINDIRQGFKDSEFDKDPLRRRDLLKKVVAFLTLGVDVSALFTDLILACVTKDIIQKKMIYFYLTNQSENNPELAILVINTLQKECKDESPLVRGLALRSLSSLRLPQLAEYLVPTLKAAMLDTSPYVRKTAILSTLKLFRIAPSTFHEMGLTEKMLGMMRDNDNAVAMNALAVLQEVTKEEGGVQVTRSILFYMLNRLRDLTEWQQAQVLQLALKYTPQNEEEMFDTMNVIEERLRGSNSAVILACANVFLYLTQNLPTVHKQVFQRLKEPLVTLVNATNCPEISYNVLCHIKLLTTRDPTVFSSSYKDFYVRYNDKTYTKCIKMEILTGVVTEANFTEIISEISVYVSDTSQCVCVRAIEALCRIALAISAAAKPVLNYFLEFMASDVEHVRGKTLACTKDFLRKYRSIKMVRPFLTSMVKCYRDMAFEDEESRVGLIWILGEFGEHIDEAPYLVESLGETFKSSESSSQLRNEILTAVVKLFFKRPPEMQKVLGKIFDQAINDFSHADVHDRALLYYRLLRANPSVAKEIICQKKETVEAFTEDVAHRADTCDRLFEEFNTSSVIYWTPSAQWNRHGYTSESDEEEEDEEEAEEAEEEEEEEAEGDKAEDEEEEEEEEEREEVEEEENEEGKKHAKKLKKKKAKSGENRLKKKKTDKKKKSKREEDSEEGGVGGGSRAKSLINSVLEFSDEGNLESSDFQAKWGKLTLENTEIIKFKFKVIPETKALEEHMESFNIFTLAQGVKNGIVKMYMFAQEIDDQNSKFLLELMIYISSFSGQVTVKIDDSKKMKEFISIIKKALKPFAISVSS